MCEYEKEIQDREKSSSGDEEYFRDCKGRKAHPRKHGGFRASAITCVVGVLENMVFLSNAINFVSYFLKSMHYSAAKSSNMVTNFMGTSFLLTIVGGFISDSFFTRFTTFIISCVIELLGLILLTYQAQHSNLKPAENRTPSKSQAAILYCGLYAIATGVGGIKASLPTHGADQLDHHKQHHMSSFFSWYFCSLCTGGLVAASVMVWVQENHGWNLSFVISDIVLALALCIFVLAFPFYRYKSPSGSPLTRIIKVFASSARNWKASAVGRVNLGAVAEEDATEQSHDKFKFLNKALLDETVDEADIEETKAFLGLLPIFLTTIMMNCCLAQLQTFSVQQGIIMNRKLHSFTIPTQSLTVLPLIIMIASIPIFENLKYFYKHKRLTQSKILQPLGRIGVGLVLASVSMAVAAIVEAKRREEANKNEAVIVSVFWLGWQYLFLAVSDALTLSGTLEFFYSKAPGRMRSMCTALSWCSASMGYFFSSVLVKISNEVSGRYGKEWLGGHDLNYARLDLFYTLLSVLNFLNFLLYLYCAKRY
ncbi:protein NRT1/ PTR FAMILY 4.2-like [Neltuma alba]|uniref:protein NRT1/ PTR FAMILY 4.2-like n=1 Tax=Neltuma alba TaxID=207710 RepID=UPI0010A471E2|nr:protein NRT1/ PTR FAMILY 4.2-like [Prosopis alba]